jgi:hypothetical protein
LEYEKQQALAKYRITKSFLEDDLGIGIAFETELFNPLRRGISLTNRALEFPPETTWLLCLDEAEFLDVIHHRILNSHLRTFSGNLAFKITTMPYFHRTLETNTAAPLMVGHDFEYVYIDQDPVINSGDGPDKGFYFASSVFNKRAAMSGSRYHGIKLKELLGSSSLLDPKNEDWGAESVMIELLRKHGTKQTVSRALKLIETPQFMDQIGRKVHGALILKEAVATISGREELGVYSGTSMAIRCSDGNPRRLIRIFNRLLLEAKWAKNENNAKTRILRLPDKLQNRILTSFSLTTLSRIRNEPKLGPFLFDVINKIGHYMCNYLHKSQLSTDIVSSVYVDQNDSREVWEVIKFAVALGLLYPNINANNPDQMPEGEGTFHLAYVLAPYFKLLPRRGSSRSLRTVLANEKIKPSVDQMDLFRGSI